MSKDTAVTPTETNFTEITDLIIDSIQDIKGKNIVKLDLRKLGEAPADFFIICEGESSTQVNAISGNIEKRLKYEQGLYPSHAEGRAVSNWVLLDYFHVIVHVFHPDARKFYEIEELWSDGETTEYQDI